MQADLDAHVVTDNTKLAHRGRGMDGAHPLPAGLKEAKKAAKTTSSKEEKQAA